METILIYQHFKKPSSEHTAPKQELVDFWMDFLVEATKKDVSSVRFPVSDSQQLMIPRNNSAWSSQNTLVFLGVNTGAHQSVPALVFVHK